LTPTPISSVTADTFNALMNFSRTKYLFYLHDANGKIYYAETNAEHEENKRNYLR
jgi:cell division protein YceG involved in septum cleavage